MDENLLVEGMDGLLKMKGRPSTLAKKIEEKMLQIREKHKDYDSFRMTEELRNRGFHVNKKKVQRLIKKLNLEVKSYTRKSRRYSSYRRKIGVVAKNLIHHRFYTSVRHQKITTEFKYFEVDT